MKYSDLKDVTFLSDLLDKLRKAKNQALTFRDESLSRVDCGGIEGFNTGYQCHVSMWKDGSGPKIELTGTYVGVEVAQATIEVIEKTNLKS